MFFFELHVAPPFFKTLVNLVLAEFKHRFGVITTGLLKAPSGFVSEVEVESVLWSWATRANVVEAKVVLVVDVGVRSLLLLDGGWAEVVFSDVSSILVVRESIFVDSLFVWAMVPADDDIDNDIGGIIDNIKALVDSRVDVDVPKSASICKDVTVPVLWR